MEISFEAAAAAHLAGDFETAERGYLGFPASRNAIYNLARLYRETGRLGEAERAYGLILSQFPDYALARRGLAMTLLAQRRYAEAWPHYEARREVQKTVPPVAAFPEWQGEPLAGKTIVVLAEQGFGDQMMFARYLPLLRDLGARVVVGCDPREIAPLFERAGYETQSYAAAGQPLQASDYWVYFCSLPLKLGLGAPPSPWRIEAASGSQGIGVAPRGNPAHENDRNRSMSAEATDAFVELGRDLRPQATGARDFLETAEVIEGLELVITVDSSAAHLTAALGKPCWVLLPRIGLDWRWNDAISSDWYPQARLFRQETPGDWDGVLAQVRAALAAG
ncbi:glycosyltransferase family 9 protein [Phenylobacterium sp.]|jgi:hypothetical protein|uniref:glycosyltransferase family 9 protein n=1 Tax=Phenylobacterium sp. TaxID=1871053 RepID=UPI002E34204E|nr:glycosyltransferase family 9 protein [Phenylobacterium sp.]HEX3363538.1 glycosyltransferase family 9 protein [Phenylobacterium sp.]